MKLKNILICLALSFFSTCTLPYTLKDNLSNFSITNSIFSVFVFVGIFLLIRYASRVSSDKRIFCISLITGFIFSVFMVFGSFIVRTDAIPLFSVKLWCMVFGLTPIFYSAVTIIFNKIDEIEKINIAFDVQKKITNKRCFLLVWGLIFVAWIPFFLASYPGVFGYDSIYQANHYLNGAIDLAHPLAHTYMLGFFVVTLGDFFGNYELGMAFYSIFQMIILAALFSVMYTIFIRKRSGIILRTIILLWYMFFPVNPIMGFSSTKDVVFSAVFALVTMLLIMVAEKPEYLKSIKFCSLLCCTVFAMLIFRNQGIYVFGLAMIIAFFLLRKYRKSIVAITLSCVLLFVLYNGPVSTALGGVKSTKTIREMMSIPCVQLSRAMFENTDELTENEKKLISEYIPDYNAYSYNSAISDIMKKSLDTDRIKENPTEFFYLWVKVGTKCFGTYVNAFARITIGLWYPDMNYRDPMAYHPYWEYWPTGQNSFLDTNKFIKITQTPVKGFGVLHDFLESVSYENKYQKAPVFSALFSSGLTFWIILFYWAFCFYKKKYMYLLPITFMIGLFLTLLLGPVVLFRYVYPLFLCMPLVIVSLLHVSLQKEVCVEQ